MNEHAEAFDKTGSLSFSKLKNLAGNFQPVFHMTPQRNAERLLSTKVIYSPIEAAVRGIKTKGYLGVDDDVIMRGRKAVVDLRERYLRHAVSPNKYIDMVSVSSLKGKKGNIVRDTIAVPSIFDRAGNIYVSHGTGHKHYGTVGIMGKLEDIASPYKTRIPFENMRSLDESAILPKGIRGKDGLVNEYIMPQFSGTFVYDPQSIPRELAKKFKEEGGVAMNSRFRRLLKAFNKKYPRYATPITPPYPISRDNIPEIAAIKEKLTLTLNKAKGV